MTLQPFFVPAALIFAAAIPLIAGLIPPNRIYGIRTSKTLSDENSWYRSNRIGGWVFTLSSAIYFTVAAIYPTSGPGDPDYARWMLHLCAFVLPLILGVILTLRVIKSL